MGHLILIYGYKIYGYKTSTALRLQKHFTKTWQLASQI